MWHQNGASGPDQEKGRHLPARQAGRQRGWSSFGRDRWLRDQGRSPSGRGQKPGTRFVRPSCYVAVHDLCAGQFAQDTGGKPVTMTGSGPLDGPPTEGKLTEEDAQAHVHGICFKTGPPHRVDLEWLVRDARDPALPVPAERTVTAVADLTAPAVLPSPATLPSGSMLTTE